MKYYILQLGCQMNISDGERIESVLQGMGFVKTQDEQEATLLGVVSCSVRQKAIDKVYSKIHGWNERKNRNEVLTFVCGCILPSDEIKFQKLFDLVFSVKDLAKLPDMIRQYGVAFSAHLSLPEEADDPIKGFWSVQPAYRSSFEAFIPIQNGCDKFCTFCAVPFTRGREVSRPSEDILREITSLVERDFKTITLLGQNVNSYGQDKANEELSFVDLLKKIGEIGESSGKEFWVYFTSPHPRDMNEEVLEVMSQYKVLANWVHLPMQSANDKVLIRMNRNHSMQKYRSLVQSINRILPEATLFTDIIVGFTDETDDQFQDTLKAMREFRFNMAYIAKYSPRPGAASFRWKDSISYEEKDYRFQELTKVLKEVSLEYNKTLLGTQQRILVEGTDRKKGYLKGRNEGKLLFRFSSTDDRLIGSFVNIQIESVAPMSMEGSLI